MQLPSAIRGAVLVPVALTGALSLLAVGPAAAAPETPRGDNGTVKIHKSSTPETDRRHEAKVCGFYVMGSGFDDNQDLRYEIVRGVPFKGTPALRGNIDVDEKGFGRSADLRLPDGHYKLFVTFAGAAGKATKHKVFKVACSATETMTPAGTPAVPDVPGTPNVPAVPPAGTPDVPAVPPAGTPDVPAVPPAGTPDVPDVPAVPPAGTPDVPDVPAVPPAGTPDVPDVPAVPPAGTPDVPDVPAVPPAGTPSVPDVPPVAPPAAPGAPAADPAAVTPTSADTDDAAAEAEAKGVLGVSRADDGAQPIGGVQTGGGALAADSGPSAIPAVLFGAGLLTLGWFGATRVRAGR